VEEELAGSEVEAFKQTIAEKDSEIAELSKELEKLQTRLHRMNRCQLDEEEEEEEKLHRLTVETSELRAKLVGAENEKQEMERRLEATHRKMLYFQELVAELREKSAASQVDMECVCPTSMCIDCVEAFVTIQKPLLLVITFSNA